ncbi:hypothetical protein ACMD2_22481 [Ananas comosus]|uniref:Uncharacterized protein n=1 Tax=Ananas comosus TaxID=4615 RepID=A0A199VX39_ANACO|nr:hypothetical protein ACMD2_22481 [Ananas comosus]
MRPVADSQGSSSPFGSIGRSILSLRRDQIPSSTDANDSPSGGGGGGGVGEVEGFQRHVAELLLDLAGDDVLSLSWARKLLDVFLICLEEFRVLLFNSGAQATPPPPPLDRLLADFFDRAVKALDVCNAVRDGVDQIRQWKKLLDIVLVALAAASAPPEAERGPIGEGPIRRARKAVTDLTILMLDEKEAGSSVSILGGHRNRSFGRSNNRDHHHHHHQGGQHRRSSSSGSSGSGSGGHYRSLSWSVSRSWSAARQLQAIGGGLAAPRAGDVAATGGLAAAVFAMSAVLFFTMWALVAAIPCQDRGLQTHFSAPPRGFPWAGPLLALQERIVEESKRKDRKHSAGLLKEIYQIERCSRQLVEITDAVHFPMDAEREAEVREAVGEIAHVCEALKEELDPLERQVREVFHRIVRSRTKGLDCLSRPHNPE